MLTALLATLVLLKRLIRNRPPLTHRRAAPIAARDSMLIEADG